MRRVQAVSILGGTFIVILSLLLACAPQATPPTSTKPSEPAPSTVKFMLFTDLTGPTASVQQMTNEGYGKYIDYVNANGGVKGKMGTAKVELLLVDTAYNPAKAKAGYSKAKSDGAICLASNMSALNDAIVSDLEKDKIPGLAGSQGVKACWSDWSYTAGPPGVADSMSTWAKMMSERWTTSGKTGKPRLAMIGEDVPYVPLMLMSIRPYCEENGIPLTIEIFPPGSTDTSTQLLRLKEAGVDWAMYCSTPVGLITLLKDYTRLGMKTPLHTQYSCGIGDVLTAVGAPVVEGVELLTWHIPMLQSETIQAPPILKVAKGIWNTNHPGKVPSDNFMYCYSDSVILMDILKLALDDVAPQDLTGETLKKYGFDRVKDYDGQGLCAKFSYVEGDHWGPKHMGLWQCKGGALYPSSGWVENTKKYPKPN